MATDVENTRRPSRVSGSGLYGVDNASVRGDKASESLIRDDDKEILRLSIQGVNLSRWEFSCWEDVAIYRAGHRKVEIQPLYMKYNSSDRGRRRSLVIDLDHAVLVPEYIYTWNPNFQCIFQKHKNAKPYLLEFLNLPDVLKFQEVFTGFSVQTHMSKVRVSLRALDRKGTWDILAHRTAIQLWRKVPTQHESFNVTTHAPHNQPHHAWNGEEGRARSEYEGSSTKIDPTTASDVDLNLSGGSAMETSASSFLVFSRKDRLPYALFRIPLDGRTSIKGQCSCYQSEECCNHIILGEDDANTSSQQTASIQTVATSSGSWLMGLHHMVRTTTRVLGWIQLEFKTIEDKKVFESAFYALKRQHGPHLGEEKVHPNHRSSKEQGSLMRKYESAAVDAENMIPAVVQKGESTEITPSYKAKAGEGGSLAPLPHSPPALAGGSSSHIGDRPDNLAFAGGRLNPNIVHTYQESASIQPSSASANTGNNTNIPFAFQPSENNNLRGIGGWQDPDTSNAPPSSNVSDDREQESIRPSIEGESRQRSLLHKSTLNDDIGPEESSRITSILATHSHLPECSPPKHLEFPAKSLPTSERPDYDIDSDSPDASFVLKTSEDEKEGSRSETQASRKFQLTSIETSAKWEQRRRRICRRMIVFMLWKREQDVCIPNELWSSPASFEFINVLEISTFDKIKGLFETYSGIEWDWWPFDPTAKPLESGKVRIRWQCACGDQRWTDASRYLARKCQALVNENTPAGHERGNATSQSADSAASHSQSGSVVPGSFPSDTSQSIEDTSNICSEAQASHNQTTYENSNCKDLYVLFCIYQQSQILHSQILATKCRNDEAFFENLRQEYRRLRGFFRFWFSPFQFSHCDFVKFTRFYVNELAKVGHSLPIDLIYQYNPRPPGPHEDPPISPHEFRRRFYTHLTNPCGRDEALVRIPKRQKRFQINLHVDGREDMWGLHVELRPCFLIVLMWQIVITAGGWAFMGWWLSRHQGDLQNAAVPVTIIVTAMMALWAPIGKVMRETL